VPAFKTRETSRAQVQDGAQPPFDPIYNLSQNELLALKDYIEKPSQELHPTFKIPYRCTIILCKEK
jgi:hypothetical protein